MRHAGRVLRPGDEGFEGWVESLMAARLDEPCGPDDFTPLEEWLESLRLRGLEIPDA